MNAFTVGQNTRMHDILNSSRSSLLNASAAVCNTVVPLALSVTSQTNISCNGGNDGSITVEAIGGSGTYTYTINGGSPQTNNTFSGLTAGNYLVEVNDGTDAVSTTVTLTEPPVLIPNIVSQIDIDCSGNNNGVIIAEAFGGTNNLGGYLFSLDGGNFSTNSIFTK